MYHAARVVQARGADVQPVGFAEGAAGFVGVANERGDRIAAREYTADDLAADAAEALITAVVIVSPGGVVDFGASPIGIRWLTRA